MTAPFDTCLMAGEGHVGGACRARRAGWWYITCHSAVSCFVCGLAAALFSTRRCRHVVVVTLHRQYASTQAAFDIAVSRKTHDVHAWLFDARIRCKH
jgi:hypothetical protein